MWFSITQNKALTLFVLVFFPVTLALGFWQLDRAAEKQRLLVQLESRNILLHVVSGDQLSHAQNYQSVAMTATLRPEFVWLHDNQVWQGRAGVDVYSLVKIGTKGLLVNLGWLRWQDRRYLPLINLPTHTLGLFGQLAQPSIDAIVLKEDAAQVGFPKLRQTIELSSMEHDAGMPLWPFVLHLQEGSEGVLQPHWQPVNMGPDKHYGYAFQWFGLALTLVVLYLYQMIKFRRLSAS